MSCTNELFPLPEIPVTRHRSPSGNLTSTSFRLWPLAPLRVMKPRGLRGSRSRSDQPRSPVKNCPVRLSLLREGDQGLLPLGGRSRFSPTSFNIPRSSLPSVLRFFVLRFLALRFLVHRSSFIVHRSHRTFVSIEALHRSAVAATIRHFRIGSPIVHGPSSTGFGQPQLCTVLK